MQRYKTIRERSKEGAEMEKGPCDGRLRFLGALSVEQRGGLMAAAPRRAELCSM